LESRRKIVGWTVFIVECADGTLFCEMCRNVRKKLSEINMGCGIYFSKHPERLPIKIVFEEKRMVFREAYAKHRYMKQMNRKLKLKLIGEKIWPMGGPWKEYVNSRLEK